MTRRPMRRVSDLLPDVAARLGIDAELQAATRARTWELLVAELVPHAAGACRLVDTRPPTLVVSAPDAATAQELRLHSLTLLDAFAANAQGERFTELRVVVSRG